MELPLVSNNHCSNFVESDFEQADGLTIDHVSCRTLQPQQKKHVRQVIPANSHLSDIYSGVLTDIYILAVHLMYIQANSLTNILVYIYIV